MKEIERLMMRAVKLIVSLAPILGLLALIMYFSWSELMIFLIMLMLWIIVKEQGGFRA